MGQPLISAAWLLVLCGVALGANFPLGRIARDAGVPSLLWAAVIASGAALLLGARHLARRRPTPVTWPFARYFAVAALISFAIPNTVILIAIPELGSGLTAIFYTLSPLATVILSRLAGLRAPSRLEYAGIGIGFVGALMVAGARGEVGRPADWHIVALGFLIPLSLAAGNVYRSIDWPKGAEPDWLAVGANGVAMLALGGAALAVHGGGSLATLATVPAAVVAQMCASAVLFFLYFRLQSIGGPVTLSQIGTVAAGVGILVGATVFGERYGALVWSGVFVIAFGISLTVLARRRG